METNTTTPAGATADTAAPTTEVVSATRDAADRGDFSAFKDASDAARQGKPPAKVERPIQAEPAAGDKPAVRGKDGAAARGPKPADRDADERLTTRIREAVETSTKTLRDENAELRRRIEGVAAKPAADGAAAEKKPAAGPTTAEVLQRYLAMPDAPKVTDFDSTVEYNAAVSVFVNDKRSEEKQTAERDAASFLEREQKSIDRVKTFHERVQGFKAAAKLEKLPLSPYMQQLHGYGTLQAKNAERAARGEQPLPATVDHAIAEEIYDSEIPGQLALHLSTHPDALVKLRACKTPQALLKAFALLEHEVAAAQPSADDSQTIATADLEGEAEKVVDRSVTSAKPPSPTLGKAGGTSDPWLKAVQTGDIGTFLEMENQKRGAKLAGRR